MSVIYFIRHGQASFGQANYDLLSEMGQVQSRVLGEYWRRWRAGLDAVYTGALARQKTTAELMAAPFTANDQPFPVPVALEEFNEYDTRTILSGSIPEVIAQQPEIAALIDEIAPGGIPDLANNKKAFQRLFSRVMELWVDGRIVLENAEDWQSFKDRVHRGLVKVMEEQGSGKEVAIVTSGGPISVAMQKAIGCPDKTALELGWVIYNCSITEFIYSGNRFSLSRFNTTPHLVDKVLLTYR